MDIKEIRRENLSRWVAEHGVPQKEKSYFSQLQAGASFGERAARRLEQDYKMGVGYLDRPQGERAPAPSADDDGFITDVPATPLSNVAGVRVSEGPKTIPIRAVKLRLQAGVSGFVEEPDMDIDHGFYPVPQYVIDKLGVDPSDLMIMKVKGRSMEPAYFEDDIVLVDKTRRSPKNNETFAINWNGELLIKCLIKKTEGWALYSFNRDYPTVSVRSGLCSIIGMVVWQPEKIVMGRL